MTNRRWTSGMLTTEDWWAVWIGLAIYALSLLSLAGFDALGWMTRPRSWERTDVVGEFEWSKLLRVTGGGYSTWHPLAAWLGTYVAFTGLLAIGAYVQRLDLTPVVLGS